MNLKLREIRISKGISVPKLVELSGVPRRTILKNVEIVCYQPPIKSLVL